MKRIIAFPGIVIWVIWIILSLFLFKNKEVIKFIEDLGTHKINKEEFTKELEYNLDWFINLEISIFILYYLIMYVIL